MPGSLHRVVTAALRIAVIAVTMLTADPAIAADSLKDLDWITGTWRGTTKGEPGEGMIERACRYVLAGRFIECHTTAMYPPQEKNKNGEVHTEVGWFSFDKRAKKIRLRQFHVEGFVNTYIESEPLVFVTDRTFPGIACETGAHAE